MENFPIIYTLLFIQNGHPDKYAKRQGSKKIFKKKKKKHVFINEFVPCAETGMKT